MTHANLYVYLQTAIVENKDHLRDKNLDKKNNQ